MGIALKVATIIAAVCLACAGCNQPRAFTAQAPPASGWQQPATAPQLGQVQDLGRQNLALDADNRDLHSELARSEQQKQLLREELGLVRERLSEATAQLKDVQTTKEDLEKEVETFTSSTLRSGGAILTANNSLRDSMRLIRIPGAEVKLDGDVVRIELPGDQLFHSGSSQLQPSAYNLLDQAADSISRAYPRQKVGIEGHSDSSPGSASAHQLTGAQALAVLDVFTRRNRLPAKQVFAVAHGSNHALASNGTTAGRAKNRRIELVIYPETFDGN